LDIEVFIALFYMTVSPPGLSRGDIENLEFDL